MGLGQKAALNPQEFPNCTTAIETSQATPKHNCIAYAFGDTTRWWWPKRPFYWPTAAPSEVTVHAFEQLLAHKGYRESATEQPEDGKHKIALFVTADGRPTHMASQLKTGRWSSKIGQNVDVEHDLADLFGPQYGGLHKVYERVLSAPAVP
jgi:hypothetical protein